MGEEFSIDFGFVFFKELWELLKLMLCSGWLFFFLLVGDLGIFGVLVWLLCIGEGVCDGL